MTAAEAGFSTSQRRSLNIVLTIASTLSLCGSLFACACYIVFRHKRTFGLQLVFLMSVNDVFSQGWVALQLIRLVVRDPDLVCARALSPRPMASSTLTLLAAPYLDRMTRCVLYRDT